VTGVVVQVHVCAETRVNCDRLGDISVIVQADQEVCPAQSLISEHIVVLPALLRRAGGDLLVDEDQVVDDRFHPVAAGVGAVILVEDGGVSLECEDICISMRLVDHNGGSG